MAAEGIAADVAADIIASLIKKSATKASYVFSFKKLVETLEDEKQKLMAKERSIKEDVKRAQWRTETVDAEVLNWLEDAEKFQKEVDELQNKIRMHNTAPCCPNFIQRYRLGRRVAKKIQKLTQHISNCKFKKFSRLATLQGMEYYSSEGFVSFESRKHAYDEIVEALKDERIRRIGVHAMGGCGKTTLVKEVGKEAEKLRLFEKVLIAVVSNSPDIRKIQASIAGSLGLKFEVEENELERSRRLSMALNNRGKILVILDDVWKKLTFEDIGIPNNCYILLTTRESSICSAMGCQKVISLKVLDDAESWILFQKHAGISDDKLDTFKDVGKKIANECKGLPVAIAVVASTLKDKGLHHWEVVLDKLKDYRQGDIEPAVEGIYKCLKLSYDNLRGEGDKSLFLLCSVYPEDFEISMEELTRNAMGLGLFGKIESNEKTRKQVSAAIDNLIDSCLLLKGDTKNIIKMHDLVHETALHLAKMENKMTLVIERSKKDIEEHLLSNDNQIRYLWWEMDKFPNQFNCPKLVFLDITAYLENQLEVPEEFFDGKKELKVLALTSEAYKDPILQLSKSIQSLTNLRHLWLTGWLLGDISFVGSLVKIETLNLYSCSFHELPDALVNLMNLRLLDMVDCTIQRSPYEVIKRCLQLEELYFVRNEYPEWEDRGENRVEFSGKLQRYHVEIGPSYEEFDDTDYSIKRYLSIKDHDAHFSTATIALIRRAEVLSLGGIHRGCTSIIPGFVQKIGDGMNELTKLIVHDSDELECVVDMTRSFYQDGTVFSNLTHLKISQLQKLEKLFLGQPHHGAFQKLEELHISMCHQLKHLIANEPREIVSDSDNPRDYNSVFPKLKLITIRNCQELEYLMPTSFLKGLLNLENLDVKGASQLKYLFSQSNLEDEGQLCNQNQNDFHVMKLEALKCLTLEDMPNVISICPKNYYPIWPSLDSLLLRNCPQLKNLLDDLEFRQRDHTITKNGIFYNLTKLNFAELDWLETLFFGTLHPGGFEKLEEISIQRCNHLKHLIANDVEKITSYGKSSWSYDSVFPKLKEITIFSCPKLEYLMPISFATGLLQLEKVDIHDASELNYVFGSSNHKAGDHLVNQNPNEPNIVNLKSLKSLSLLDLPNIMNICPETYYPIWPSLYSLVLERCPRLNIKPIKNCIVGLELRQQHHTITKELGAAMISNVQNLISLSVFDDNEVDGLFHLQGIPMDGQQVTAGLINMHLEFLPELKYIWSGPKQFLSLQNLQSLKIENCQKLEVVFPTSILRSLNQLKMLHIMECQELHQIFEVDAENKDQSNPHSGHVCLPKLITLIVQQCNKLKCLFSFTTSFELPKLKFLIVKEASELEEVITCENNDRKEKMHVKFPALEHIVLVQLPKLREVYQKIVLETAKYRIVHHCPKLSLMSSDTLENMKEIYKDYESEDGDDDDDDEYDDDDDDVDDDSDDDEAVKIILDIVSHLLDARSNEIQNEIATLEIHSQHQIDQAAFENELHSSKDDTNPTIQGSEAQNGQNDDCIKSEVFTSFIASSNLTESINEPEKELVGTVLDQKTPVIATPTYEPELASRLNPSHGTGWLITLHTTTSVSIKEKGQESDQENHKSKDIVIAPLSVHSEASNKRNVEEGPAFDYVTLTHANSTSSPQPGQPQEKEDHCEGPGNDSKNKHHEENFGSLSGLSTSMPEAQSRAMQSEDKSHNWEKFLTLSLFSGPQMVEESPPKKTTYHHIVPEKLNSEIGIIGETANRSVQKSPVSAQSEEKTSSMEFTTSSQLSFSADVPPPISTPSPTSLYFSNTPNAEGGFDLNKPPTECFEDIEQKIQVINTSSNDSKFTTRSSPGPLPVPVRTTPSLELMDEQPKRGGSLKDQQVAVEETDIHFQTYDETNRIKKTVEASHQEGPKMEEIWMPPLPTDLEMKNLPSGPQSTKGSDNEVPVSAKATSPVTPSIQQGETRDNQTKAYVGEDDEKFKDDDLVGLLQSMEEDSDSQAPKLSISKTAAKNHNLEDKLVAKALADLEVSLKLPLKDIASKEAASLRLENALNFLSCHSFKDDIASYELKAAIDSLHQEFPSILSSFKQASATVDRFTLLEDKEKSMKEELPRRKESAVTLIGNISKTEMSMAEIQQEEVSLMEKISRLEDELNNVESRKRECQARLSSLQEQKHRSIAETKEFKKEFESVKEDKSQMIEDHGKAQQELFKVNNKWSALYSQFQQNHSAKRSLS